MSGGGHVHVELELFVDVALEFPPRDEAAQTPPGARDAMHDVHALRSTSVTASVNRCQLSVSICSCFLPSAVSR